MHFNHCALCNHANVLTARSCAACGVGMVAICARCGTVNDTVRHRCQHCNMTLPAGKAAEEMGSPAPAASSLDEFFAVTNTVNRPEFRVRFNNDRSISIEVPDGRGGVVVHNVSPPVAEPDAAPVWLQLGDAAEPLLTRPAEPEALSLERATELVPAQAMSLADPLIQHAPQHWPPTRPRRRLAIAVVGFALLFAAGFYIASPNSAAWLASVSGSPNNTAKTNAAAALPIPPAVTSAIAPVPEPVSPSAPSALSEPPPVTVGTAAPSSTAGDASPSVARPVVRSNTVQPAQAGAVATATLDAAPPPVPLAPATSSGDIQKSVDALENSPPSAGTRQSVARTASSGTRPTAAPPQAPPAAVAAVTGATNAIPTRRTRPAENVSPESPAALAAALGSTAPTRAAPPAPPRAAVCTDALAALGLCNTASSSTNKE